MAMLNDIAIAVFAVIAIAYLVQLRILVKALRGDESLWKKLGSPSLMSLRGQQKFDQIIFSPRDIPITEERLLRMISLARFLMIAGVASFSVAAVTFFLSGKAGALGH